MTTQLNLEIGPVNAAPRFFTRRPMLYGPGSVRRLAPGIYRARSDSAKLTYEVDLWAEPHARCTCKGQFYHGYCRHVCRAEEMEYRLTVPIARRQDPEELRRWVESPATLSVHRAAAITVLAEQVERETRTFARPVS
jgi:hypothetical protein